MSRFVNNVMKSSLDKEEIGSYIKTIRLEYLKKNIDVRCNGGFINEADINLNIEKLSQLIGAYNVSYEEAESVSNDSITTGAEMFFALNSCPSDLLKLYWKTIYGPQSRTAILASNIVKKEKKDRKIKAIKMFAKIASMLRFQHISYYHHVSTGRFEKRLNVEGKPASTCVSVNLK